MVVVQSEPASFGILIADILDGEIVVEPDGGTNGIRAVAGEAGGQQVRAMLRELLPDLRVGPVEFKERGLEATGIAGRRRSEAEFGLGHGQHGEKEFHSVNHIIVDDVIPDAFSGLMKSPLICCPRCEGTGKAKLDSALDETLRVMGKEWEPTSLIYDHLDTKDVGQTAISNRLNELLALQLVECERRGKTKWWRRK